MRIKIINNKTDKVVNMSKEKSSKRVAEVMADIKKMEREGKKVNFYSVHKQTQAAKSFLYDNETLYNKITSIRDGKIASKRTEKSKEAIIAALQITIKNLQKRIRELEDNNNDSYMMKNEKLFKENRNLKEQLKKSYDY